MFKGLKKEIQDEYRQTLKHLVSGPLREEITDRSFAQTDIAGACGLGGGGRREKCQSTPGVGMCLPAAACQGPGAGRGPRDRSTAGLPSAAAAPAWVPSASRQLWAAQPSPIPGGGEKCDISKWDIKV